MLLGILSDTHGSGERTASALVTLKRAGAEAFVHCGDVGSEAVLDEMAGLRCWFVWGNCDEPSFGFARYARQIGLEPPGAPPLLLELSGKRIAVFHGHECEFFQQRDDIDYVLHGHTHRARDVKIGNTRVINPGAMTRARVHTAATLDLANDRVTFWIVPLALDGPPQAIPVDQI